VLKYILTAKCYNDCPYCITSKLRDFRESDSLVRILSVLRSMRIDGHSAVMLTGGEPTLHPLFFMITGAARAIFDQVHLATSNSGILDSPAAGQFSSIVLSIHDSLYEIPSALHCKTKVYGGVMAHRLQPALIDRLYSKGFSGLTINEDHRGGGKTLPGSLVAQIDRDIKAMSERFSLKINRVGACMNETFIMPDLTIETDFTKYL